MNAGQKTIVIAKGIMLWAKVQAVRTDSYDYEEAKAQWDEYCLSRTKKEIDFIFHEQYRLFDQVNDNL